MNSNNVDLSSADVLESYLDDTLAAAQRRAVEQRIAADPAYASMIKQARQFDTALHRVGRQAQSGSIMRPAAEAKARAAMHSALDGKAPVASGGGLRLAAPVFALILIALLAVFAWPGINSALLGQPAPIAAPSAVFRWEQLSKQDRNTVQFTNLSSNYTTATWNFGDGQTSAAPNPLHIYAKSGDYNVTLTVSNSQLNATTTQVILLR
jgi:hypothetical protein